MNAALATVKVPVRVSWPKAIKGGAPLRKYKLQISRDEGAWTKVSLPSPLAREATVKLRPSAVSRLRLRAVDATGLAGPWATTGPLWLGVVHDQDVDIDYVGAWSRINSVSSYGGSVHSSQAAGAKSTHSFQGSQVAMVAPRGPNFGASKVSINGGTPTAVNLWSASAEARRIVFARSWAQARERSMLVTVDGTAGHPRVDLDTFLTLGPPPTGVLVGAGDIAVCGSPNDEATAEVVKATAGTVFTTGDNVYARGTAAEFRDCYDPSWGQFRNRTRPSSGNHDYRDSPTAAPYFKYFGSRAGTPGQGWYAYDSGTWRVYALNSNCANIGGCTTSSAQYAWLKSELAANPRRCVAAYWHHPRFSSGPHGNSTAMSDVMTLLYDRGAEVVIAGHDHSYERFTPMTPSGVVDGARGLRTFVVGTGGGPLYAPGTVAARNSEVLETQTYGVLKLTLDWSGYSWKFLAASGGTFSDSGTGTCH